MDDKQKTATISKAIIEYYSLEINEKMPSVIIPREDPNLVCCVMDKLHEGQFRKNVVYGKGEYFNNNVDTIEQALHRSTLFKELLKQDDGFASFSYIGGRR